MLLESDRGPDHARCRGHVVERMAMLPRAQGAALQGDMSRSPEAAGRTRDRQSVLVGVALDVADADAVDNTARDAGDGDEVEVRVVRVKHLLDPLFDGPALIHHPHVVPGRLRVRSSAFSIEGAGQ
eukprot:3227777-Rhodomonas_salina.4